MRRRPLRPINGHAVEQGALCAESADGSGQGGARLGVKSGKIANILAEPVGQLQLQLNTIDVPGLVPVVDKLAPDSPFARWLRASAPHLSPLNASISIQSNIVDGRAVTQVKLDGKANATTPEAKIVLTGSPLAWRDADVAVDASVTSYEALELARQIGIVRADAVIEGWAELKLSGKGVPSQGLAMDVKGSFGGLGFGSKGTLAMPPAALPTFTGEASLSTDDLAPVTGPARDKVGAVDQRAGDVSTTDSTRRRVRLTPEQRRAQILEAATTLVARHGFYGVSLQDVATEVGITQAGLLHHVGSKEGLLELLVSQRYDRQGGPDDFVASGDPSATHPDGPSLPGYFRWLVDFNARRPQPPRR